MDWVLLLSILFLFLKLRLGVDSMSYIQLERLIKLVGNKKISELKEYEINIVKKTCEGRY